MHGGYREFCENVRHNAIKRFFKKSVNKLKKWGEEGNREEKRQYFFIFLVRWI
jgi:hypothetical protein